MAFSGERLRDARTAAGISQPELAATVGTTQGRISDWERGRAIPRARYIPKLAAALGMDALDFSGADPDRPELEALRLAAGLSMEAIAAAAGTTTTRYRRLERGELRHDLEPELIESLAVVLAVPAVVVRRAAELARITAPRR